MKIVYVISGLGAGGAEKILVEQANYFVKKGYDISIVLFNSKESFYKLDSTIKIIRLQLSRSKIKLYRAIENRFSIITSLREVFLQENPDVIISFITKTNISSTIAAKLAKKTIILSEHTNYTRNARDFLGFVRRVIYPLADAVVVLTNYDKIKYNFVKNVYVIKNPLVIKNTYFDIERKKILLGVGRLVHLKGFDLLLKAFSHVKVDDWKLVIVGEGPKRKELEQLAKDLKIDNIVEFPGLTQDIEKYYKEASIFVLSSRIEGFPNALCEAMGYGCPSIAYNCLTGPSDIIIDGQNGILVEAENIHSLANKIEKLIYDVELRDQLGYNARTILNKLDVNLITKQWIQVFKDLNIEERSK